MEESKNPGFPYRGRNEDHAGSFAAPSTILHGEALARSPWLEQWGGWIVGGFIGIFVLLLVAMNLAGQLPGQSFLLKVTSDVFQTAGQWIGCSFCLWMAYRLFQAAKQARLAAIGGTRYKGDALSATRAGWAWLCLGSGCACYGLAGIIWTSYDARMPTAQVPYPGWYDVGYVAAYPFFVLGTVLLARRNQAAAERARLLLDALLVIGTALSLSWFFLLGPSIAGLAHSSDPLAALLAIYFPAGDLLLIMVSVLLLFGPLSTRAQEPVLLRLCLGLSCLATADSLLGYLNLIGGFNSGTLLDLLWPLSLLLVGMAAIEYPRCVAQEQMKHEKQHQYSQAFIGQITQLGMTAQTIVPFLLALLASAVLLLVIAPRSHSDLIAATLIALVLVVLVVIRQALTLMENNRALQATQREAQEAERLALENQAFTEGVKAIQAAHARIARGDLSVRVPTTAGPLLPISMSLNLMLDRLNAFADRTSRYENLLQELPRIQEMIEELASDVNARSAERTIGRSQKELQPVWYALAHVQRFFSNHWQRLFTTTRSLEELSGRMERMLGEIGEELRASHQDGAPALIRLEQTMRTLVLLRQELSMLRSLAPEAGKASKASFAPDPSGQQGQDMHNDHFVQPVQRHHLREKR
jgi:uncharacterized membrane protein